jgi:hypothetical protein
MLVSFCLGQMQTMAALIKSIKMNKKDIFGGSVPMRGMGPIHALCLQLVTNGIIHLGICDNKKHCIGKKALNPKHVIMKLGAVDSDPAVLQDHCWEGINVMLPE